MILYRKNEAFFKFFWEIYRKIQVPVENKLKAYIYKLSQTEYVPGILECKKMRPPL